MYQRWRENIVAMRKKKEGHTYTEINALDPQLALAFTGPAHCFTLLVYSHHTFSAHQTADAHSYPQAGEHRARYFPLELVKNREWILDLDLSGGQKRNSKRIQMQLWELQLFSNRFAIYLKANDTGMFCW